MLYEKQYLYKVTHGKEPEYNFAGIDCPNGKLIAVNDNVLIVKTPSTTCWCGIGLDRSYVPPETFVFQPIDPPEQPKMKKGNKVVKPGESGWYKCLISYENTRKKKQLGG